MREYKWWLVLNHQTYILRHIKYIYSTLADDDRPNSLSFHHARRFEKFLCRVVFVEPGTPYTGSGSANQSLCSSSASLPSSQVYIPASLSLLLSLLLCSLWIFNISTRNISQSSYLSFPVLDKQTVLHILTFNKQKHSEPFELGSTQFSNYKCVQGTLTPLFQLTETQKLTQFSEVQNIGNRKKILWRFIMHPPIDFHDYN